MKCHTVHLVIDIVIVVWAGNGQRIACGWVGGYNTYYVALGGLVDLLCVQLAIVAGCDTGTAVRERNNVQFRHHYRVW